MADRNPLDLTWQDRVIARFDELKTAEEIARGRQKGDYEFSYGDDDNKYQWDADAQGVRKGRPMLTNNRVDQYVKRIANTIRAEMPSGQVIPIDSVDDPEIAGDIEGVLRFIQSNSDADVAHMTAVNWQLRGGVGFWRIVAERTGASLDQDLAVKRIPNRFTVYLGACNDPTGADAWDCFITERLDEATYLKRYGSTALASKILAGGTGDVPASWMPGGGYLIAEYFERIENPEKPGEFLCQWATINGVEVLEGNEQKTGPRTYPIPFIPVIRLVGDEFIDPTTGETDYRGMVRTAKDPQRFANYLDSQTAEAVALTPKAPYVGYEGQFENHPEWDTANSTNWSKLEAKATVKGVPGLLPLPQRQMVEPAIQGLSVLGQRATNNLRAVLGEVDADAQERHPEQSGKAALIRQHQGEMGNSHFRSNLGRALKHEIRILLAWLPFIYDVPRQLRILGRDDQAKTVVIHAGNAEAIKSMALPPNVKVYDMADLTFDVAISEGPAFATKRQEAFEAIGEVIAKIPQLIPIVGDLYFDHMDVPVAKQMAERLKKSLPPNLQEQQGGKGQPEQQLAQMQQQMQQLGQQHEMLVKELEAKNAFIESEQAKLQSEERRTGAELQSKERIAQLNAETDIRVTLIKLEAERQIEQVKLQMALRTHAADLHHESDESTMDRMTELRQADQGRAHDAGMSAMGQSHEAREAAAGRSHESSEADRSRAHASGEAEADRDTQVALHGMGGVGGE